MGVCIKCIQTNLCLNCAYKSFTHKFSDLNLFVCCKQMNCLRLWAQIIKVLLSRKYKQIYIESNDGLIYLPPLWNILLEKFLKVPDISHIVLSENGHHFILDGCHHHKLISWYFLTCFYFFFSSLVDTLDVFPISFLFSCLYWFLLLFIFCSNFNDELQRWHHFFHVIIQCWSAVAYMWKHGG